MKEHSSGASEKATGFFRIFGEVTESVVQSLGEKPFHLRMPLNVSALDSVMSVLVEHHRALDYSKLKERYSNLVNDSDFKEYTRINTTDTGVVKNRIKRVKEYILG